jgi:hypothetical protein
VLTDAAGCTLESLDRVAERRGRDLQVVTMVRAMSRTRRSAMALRLRVHVS